MAQVPPEANQKFLALYFSYDSSHLLSSNTNLLRFFCNSLSLGLFFLREAVKPKHFQSIFHTGVNYHKLYPITNRLRRHSDRFHSYSSFHPCSSQRPLSKQPLQAVFFWKDSSCHYGAAGLSAHYNTAAPLCISPRGWVPQPVRNAGGFR